MVYLKKRPLRGFEFSFLCDAIQSIFGNKFSVLYQQLNGNLNSFHIMLMRFIPHSSVHVLINYLDRHTLHIIQGQTRLRLKTSNNNAIFFLLVLQIRKINSREADFIVKSSYCTFRKYIYFTSKKQHNQSKVRSSVWKFSVQFLFVF